MPRATIWLAILPLAGGAGLLVYYLAGFSLLVGIALALMAGALAAWAVFRRASAAVRPALKQRVLVGIAAGVAATLAYDLSRFVLVKVAGLSFWPFDVFPLFGRLLLGADAPPLLAEAAGLLYHYCNGVGFAVGFMFVFRRPGIGSGLLWAAMLELFMVSLYPSWLNLQALDEFLSVSILGHAVYGIVLGMVARRVS